MDRPYQVIWWDDPASDLSLNSPYWAIGLRLLKVSDNFEVPQYLYAAAVIAASTEEAIRLIVEAYDDVDPDIEWCSIEEQPYGWSPFSRERPRLDWMVWSQRPH